MADILFFRFLKVKEHGRDIKIDQYRAGVHQCGDQRGSHDCRVQADFFRQEGQQTSDQLGNNDGSGQRQADHQGQGSVFIHNQDTDAICQGKRHAHNEGYAKFLENDLENVFELDLTKRDAAYDQGGAL